MRTPDCHPDRPYQAKGMCQQCYMRDYDEQRKEQRAARNRKDPSEYAPNYRKPPRKPARIPDCHSERKHVALGMCGPCYQRQLDGKPRATACEHTEAAALALGLCRACYGKQRYWGDPEDSRAKARELQADGRKRTRDQLIEAYGGKCACPNCPETNSAFLTLDHVNGGGRAHRMKMGSHTYADLRRQGFPQEGYRLLCWNCNGMTRDGRRCPHEEEAQSL